jgi:competence protein ComEC
MQWWIVRRRVHSSWLITALSVGVVVGVISAQYFPVLNDLVWLWIGLLLATLGVWRGRIYALVFMVVAGGMIGLWRGSLGQQQLTPYKNIIGYTATLRGTITEDPDTAKDGALVLRLGGVTIDGHSLPGMVWVSASEKPDIRRGDRVTVKGKLSDGFGNFAASSYRAHIVTAQRPMPGDVAGRLRDGFAGRVRQAVPEPEASLGLGYLLGQRRSLPPELGDALKIAGLTHVVVASGYNLTILVRLARRLFEKVSKYMAALSGALMIVAFILVTGLSPSMSRAGLVAGLSLIAWYYGRKFHPLVLLPFAAAVTLLVNPSYGWNDLGWQLSFAAFGGVMIVAPLLQRYFFGDKEPGTVRQIVGETVSAQIATLPILVIAFGQFSNVAVIANILVLPFVPLAMLLTFIAGLGVLAWPPSAVLVGRPAEMLLSYMVTVAQYFAHLPWAQTDMKVGIAAGAAYYAVLVGALWYMWRVTKFDLRGSNIVE